MADRPAVRIATSRCCRARALFKTVFKAVKAAAGGLGLDRVFITGVSPMVLSDMTSGYNVGETSIWSRNSTICAASPRPRWRRCCEQLAAEGADAWSADDALATMRTFYNGYRFSEDAGELSTIRP
jgi:hypothetical protein